MIELISNDEQRMEYEKRRRGCEAEISKITIHRELGLTVYHLVAYSYRIKLFSFIIFRPIKG